MLKREKSSQNMQKQEKETTINYNEHNYGQILRASGIFYFKKTENFKTTISFLDYWKIKRNLETTIIASLRKMNGELVFREKLEFNDSYVINYSPNIVEKEFEGSIEIEIFSLEDMKIPYAGIMVVYESKFGVSMVHTYGRTYSHHEIEEEKTLRHGEETSCHAFEESEDTKSFAVVHNGNIICPKQNIEISVLNYLGKRKNLTFELKELKPYETVRFNLKELFPGIVEFLKGKPGYSSFSFSLNSSAFPRMLTIKQKNDNSDFQVTHSNFNLSKHKTPMIENEKFAFMSLPNIPDVDEKVIVYPDCGDGEFEITTDCKNKINFNKDKGAEISKNQTTDFFFRFEKVNDFIPTRIHTGVRISKSSDRLSAETCLGVFHKLHQEKRFFWGICANSHLKSRIFLQQMDLGEVERKNLPVIIKLYSEKSKDSKEIQIDPRELKNGKYIHEIFSDTEEFLGSGFGWFTVFSEHPHYVIYSSLENKFGSMTFEHGI